MTKLYAPQVERYAHRLGRFNYMGADRNTVYDAETYRLLDMLFQKLDLIEQRPDSDGIWDLWLQADRGPIEAFGNFQEMLEDEDVSSYEEYVKLWRESYPAEHDWYSFTAVRRPDNEYRGVFLCHRQVISQFSTIPEGYPLDIHEFVQWLVDAVDECIDKLRSGTYNREVAENLPPQHRTGYVLQKDFWSLFPDSRDELLGGFTQEELNTFSALVQAQEQGEIKEKRLAQMTSGDFFRFCAMGYAANNYSDQQLSPREQYLKHADGRDEGLTKLPEDDPAAFLEWFNSSRGGGHPWEICRGGNSTHIDLFPRQDEKGFFLVLAGDSWGRTAETIKIFLALSKSGIPVILREAKALGERVAGIEKMGIVPEGVFPRYCHSYFPDEHIIDFINLPLEHREELSKLCVWQPIPEVRLVD